MADTKLNPIFEGFSKKIGNLVFCERNGKTIVRRLGEYHDAKSEAQMAQRGAFSDIAGDWGSLAGIIQKSWKEFARGKKMTGYNAFMKANSSRQRTGQPLELSKPMGEERLDGFTATSGESSGEISFAFTPLAAGRHLTLFLQKRVDGMGEGPFVRHNCGADPVFPLSVSGLEAGGSYFIYAVVTDRPYAEATTVSASVSAAASACV